MSDDLLRVCYTHEVGMQHLDPDRLPFACTNCGEDSAEVNRLQALVSEQAREIDALRARAERAESALFGTRTVLGADDGEVCWCPRNWEWSEHHTDCVKVRAALAAASEGAGEGA